jgi:hypothetical protein
LGLVLMVTGLVVWSIGALLYLGNKTGFFPTIPYAGGVTTALGAFADGIGWAIFRGEPALGALEKRRTSLVIVIPAMVLFGIVLLAAAMVFGANFEAPATPQRWLGSAAFLGVSLFIFAALVRDVALRFGGAATAPAPQ